MLQWRCRSTAASTCISDIVNTLENVADEMEVGVVDIPSVLQELEDLEAQGEPAAGLLLV